MIAFLQLLLFKTTKDSGGSTEGQGEAEAPPPQFYAKLPSFFSKNRISPR